MMKDVYLSGGRNKLLSASSTYNCPNPEVDIAAGGERALRDVPSINSNSRARTTLSILTPREFEPQLRGIREHACNSVTPESACGLERNEVRLDSVAVEAMISAALQVVS